MHTTRTQILVKYSIYHSNSFHVIKVLYQDYGKKNQFRFHSSTFQNTYAIGIGFYVHIFFLFSITENYLEMCYDINMNFNLIDLSSILVINV